MFSLIFKLIKLKFYWKKHFTIVFHDFFKIMLSFSLKAYQWVIAKSGKTNSLLVGNTAKGRISKRVLQEKKTRQIFRKRNISFLLIRTHVCLPGDKICSFFGKSGGLFFCNTRFETHAFGLLPTESLRKLLSKYRRGLVFTHIYR